MDLNTKFIQIRGKIETDQELKHGDDIQVTVTVTDIQDSDNQDGTMDRVYKCKLWEDR